MCFLNFSLDWLTDVEQSINNKNKDKEENKTVNDSLKNELKTKFNIN
jgi:hypothetical protein